MADTSNLAGEQEKASNQARFSQHYQCVQAKLETLSAEQLNLYLHEVKWLLNQLGKVIPDQDAPNQEMHKQSSHIEAQVVIIQEALILERARRSLVNLQAQISNLTLHTCDAATPMMVEHVGEPTPNGKERCPEVNRQASMPSKASIAAE